MVVVDLGEIANEITEWSNSTEKGVIYQARFVAHRHEPSNIQVELCPFKATSKDKDLRQLEEIILAYYHWAKHLYNLGSGPSVFALNQDMFACAKAIDPSPRYAGYFSSESTRAKRSRVTPDIKWQTTLKRKRNGELYVRTRVPWRGNPRVMAPASVFPLFDHLMDSLGDAWRPLLLVGVGAMHRSYATQGHPQTAEKPLIGMQAVFRQWLTGCIRSGRRAAVECHEPRVLKRHRIRLAEPILSGQVDDRSQRGSKSAYKSPLRPATPAIRTRA